MDFLDTVFTYVEYILCFVVCIIFILILIEDREWKKLFLIIIGVPVVIYLTYLFTIFLDWAFTNHPQACMNVIIISIIAIILYGISVMIDNYLKNSHNEKWKKETKENLLKELKNFLICFMVVIVIIGMVVLMSIGSMT